MTVNIHSTAATIRGLGEGSPLIIDFDDVSISDDMVQACALDEKSCAEPEMKPVDGRALSEFLSEFKIV